MKNGKAISWILFILLAIIWGSSFILIKKGTEQLDGWQIGAVRIFAAAVVFLPFGLFHLRQLPQAKVPIVILTGILGNLLPAFLFSIAIEHKIASSVAGILNSLTPLFVILIGVLFFKTSITTRKIVGVLIGFVGLVVLSIAKGPVSIGDIGFTMLILLATVLYGVNVNIVGAYLKGLDPIKMATVSITFLIIPTGIVLALNPVALGSPEVRKSVYAVVLLGLLGSAAATVIFYALIKRAGGLFASLVTYVIPLIAMIWGFLDGEEVGLLQLGCLGIILIGVYLTNKS